MSRQSKSNPQFTLKTNKGKVFEGLFMIDAPVAGLLSTANVYLVRDQDGLVMIDVGCGGEKCFTQLLKDLEEQGLDPQEIHTVILSHAHADHMGAISKLRELRQMEVIIHEEEVIFARNPELLENAFDIPLARKYFPEQGAKFKLLSFYHNVSCDMCSTEPDRSVNEGDRVEAGDFLFEVIHTPGHAPGHICLYESKKRLLFSGDMLGKEVAFYTPSAGGATGYLQSLEKLGRLEAEIILPSHGEPIEEPPTIINKFKEKIIRREHIILQRLAEGPQDFKDLLSFLFKQAVIHFMPGVAILESHLVKLEKEGKIKRSEDQIELCS